MSARPVLTSCVLRHTSVVAGSAPSHADAPEAVALMRHLVATVAYRAAKVLRDPPTEFATTSVDERVRRPVEIVAHMADLMAWARSIALGHNRWSPEGSGEWDREVQRLCEGLRLLDETVSTGTISARVAEQLVQGPLADALTHVGQLALLRNLAGAPVRPENYAKAQVVAGCLGLQQAPPVREFDGDASARRPT
jgi:hypothetical protein